MAIHRREKHIINICRLHSNVFEVKREASRWPSWVKTEIDKTKYVGDIKQQKKSKNECIEMSHLK